MKKRVFIIMLLVFPLVGQARWNNHFKHDNHNHYDIGAFWHDVQLRCDDQARQINRGVEKGALTRREQRKLKREQRHIAKQIKHFKRHNHLTRYDRSVIMEHLDYVGEQIAKLKHNNQYVYKKRTQHGDGHNNHLHHHDHSERKQTRLFWGDRYSSAGFYFKF